jgi:hypothetical protein
MKCVIQITKKCHFLSTEMICEKGWECRRKTLNQGRERRIIVELARRKNRKNGDFPHKKSSPDGCFFFSAELKISWRCLPQ